MQTFLPYSDFTRSAEVLDQARLGKQRVESLQVLRGLTVPGYGWRHHPAVRMWIGYEEALVRYGLDVCAVWVSEGRADTCATTLATDFTRYRPGVVVRLQDQLAEDGELPPWLGDPAFHRSHQSALVRKAPEIYSPVFPDIADDLPYLWPTSDRTPT
ncbi:MSMEG_6728 family protein [Streptomyces sp. NPDC050535]|uniref:MSMEG_6728 family protein n=1 Tax=Streptomyces sp. NPDC050535 TaxID=3365626 RepID=UPI0037B5AA39